jgi:predicted amidophosphoribosyltransferase
VCLSFIITESTISPYCPKCLTNVAVEGNSSTKSVERKQRQYENLLILHFTSSSTHLIDEQMKYRKKRKMAQMPKH